MRRLILTLLITTTFATACRSQTRSPAQTTIPATRAPEGVNLCESPQVAEQLRTLHHLAVAEQALPARLRDQLQTTVAELAPIGAADASVAFSLAPMSVQIAPVVHHAARFEGEETPSIVHWNLESLGAPTTGIRYALNRKVADTGADEVHLALWSNTSAVDVERILTALNKAGVERVNLVGRRVVEPFEEISAPGAARKRFAELRMPENTLAAARADATMELERIVFDASNHRGDFRTRILSAQDSFDARSASYVDWLLAEQARSGCSVPDEHLVWLYRARFLADAPIAILPTAFAVGGIPFDFTRDKSYADIAASYERAFANAPRERLAILP